MVAPIPPVVIIVTGAWHVPAHYELVAIGLRKLGFIIDCPRLSSTDLVNNPGAGLPDDIAVIRASIESFVATGHQVILLMHSYGGAVGTGALTAELTHEHRARVQSIVGDDLPGGVTHAIFTAAFVLPACGCLLDTFGGKLPSWATEDSSGLMRMNDPRGSFCSDLPPEEADKWLNIMVTAPDRILRDRLKSSGFEGPIDVPVTYLVTTQERDVTKEIQEVLAARLGEHRRVKYINSAHCPMVSKPNKVVDAVCRAWESSGGDNWMNIQP